MYINIGENTYIRKKDIVAILNAKTMNPRENSTFINRLLESSKSGKKETADIKSYVIVCSKRINRRRGVSTKRCKIYVSNISSTTLLKRFEDLETRLEV